MAVQGICWAKMFHLRVELVEPSVCVNEIVSVDVAPNSTYTGKVKVIARRQDVNNKTYCGNRCWCRRWKESFFQFGLAKKIKSIAEKKIKSIPNKKIKSIAEVKNNDWHLMQ